MVAVMSLLQALLQMISNDAFDAQVNQITRMFDMLAGTCLVSDPDLVECFNDQ
jgi:hypothetical protein